MANDEERGAGGDGVMLLVCEMCGREYQLEAGEEPPPDLTCVKCGNQVFRRFDDAPSPDEAQADFRDSTERDLRPDDPEGDATPGDVLDLGSP